MALRALRLRRATVRDTTNPLAPFFQRSSTRMLSNSSSGSDGNRGDPDGVAPLQNGLPLLASTLWRCASQYSTLERWHAQELIPSSLSVWDRHRLFMLLHTPEQLAFDADEFLAGASLAIEKLLRSTKTRAFAEFALQQKPRDADGANANANEPTNANTNANTSVLTRASVVDDIRTWCTPRGFTFHVDAAREMQLQERMLVECEHVEIERIQLQEAVYGQVSPEEFAQELQGTRRVVNEITEQASLERLFVSVKVTVRERLRRELYESQVVQVIDQSTVYFAVLASNVTTPQALDWGIVANVEGNTLRWNELSRVPMKQDEQEEPQVATEA